MIHPIKISFPENCSHNLFRIFYLNGYYKGHLMAYGTIYIDQTAIDNNYGNMVYFWIGQDLKPDCPPNIDWLKNLDGNGQPRIKYFYDFRSEVLMSDDLPPVY